MKLLLIEDDLDIGGGAHRALGETGFEVVWVRTLSRAMDFLEADSFEIAVLDLGLPDGDGMTWLRRLRERGLTQPVLILSARDALSARLTGLEDGADDFLLKPFVLDELIARLKAMLRRWRGFQSGQLQVNDLVLDEHAMRLFLRGNPVRLSPTEFQIVHVLLKRLGRVVPRSTLESLALNDGGAGALDMHISNLRRKLGRYAVRTVRGIGFVIDKDAFHEVD